MRTYVVHGVENGVTTNIKGTVLVKNNDVENNKINSNKILKAGKLIVDDIAELMESNTDNWVDIAIDKNLRNKHLNEFVNENVEVILDIYREYLKEYNIEIEYICNIGNNY